MTLCVASVVSLIVFLFVVFSCYRNGLYSSVAMLFVVVLSAAAALMCVGPVPRMMLFDQLDWYGPPIVFLGVFLLSFLILQTLANFMLPPSLTLSKLVDKLGGTLVGLVVALYFTGALMTAFDLFPGTGDKGEKVTFLSCDEALVRTMSFMSARAGSMALNADEFLRLARQEKFNWEVRKRTEMETQVENDVCNRRLGQLGTAIRKYTEASNGVWPASLKEIVDYLPPYRSKNELEDMLSCPATRLPYVLFPLKNTKDIDRNTILAYDRVGGETFPHGDLPAGHLGNEYVGRRFVLFGDWQVRLITEIEFHGLLKAQIDAQKG